MRLLTGLLLVCVVGLTQAQIQAQIQAQVRDIATADLPPEGRTVLALIAAGGPFPYKRDGIVFNNFEKLLPLQKRGYYREYTVPTPDLRHRGPRRIVCGGWQVRRPDTCWYTADHYRSFRKIVE